MYRTVFLVFLSIIFVFYNILNHISSSKQITTTLSSTTRNIERKSNVEKYLNVTNASLHSGFYRPSNWYSIESYCGAWLVSSKRFFSKSKEIEATSSLEGISFAVANEMNEKRQLYEWNMMTRDFFDFQVVHLSSSSNLAIEYNPKHPETIDHIHILTERLKRFTFEMESIAAAKVMKESLSIQHDGNNQDELYENTLAILPFTTFSATRQFTNRKSQQYIRIEFFKATYWSIRRYVKHICVSVGTEKDLKILKEIQMTLKFPIFQIIDLSSSHSDNHKESPTNTPPSGQSNLDLPKRTLLHIINTVEPIYREFKYIYYSEADQLLYLRTPSELTKAIDVDPDKHALLPHRMHTSILPFVYPEIRNVENEKPPKKSVFLENLQNINVINLDTEGSDGSCCDDGRFVFKRCTEGFWYRCSEWVRLFNLFLVSLIIIIIIICIILILYINYTYVVLIGTA